MSVRKKLISELSQKWEYSNNTSYYKTFRQQKTADMISKITYYLESNQELLHNERYVLMCLIRALSLFLVEKTPDNKKAVKRQLKNLEIISESGEGNL